MPFDPKTIANLNPAKPGEVRNPKGHNQYTNGGLSPKAMTHLAFKSMMSVNTDYEGQQVPYLTAFMARLMDSALEGGWGARILGERLLSQNILDEIDTYLTKSFRENTDFLSYRIYKTCSDIQQKILASKMRIILEMAGRRAGKTLGHIKRILDTIVPNGAKRALYIAKKHGVGIEQVYTPLLAELADLGIKTTHEDRAAGDITLANDSIFSVRSNDNAKVREDLRGGHWDLIIIDECQSQPMLKYLVESICEPMLEDTRGVLIMSGTGPRSAGTYWEYKWINDNPEQTLKLNWNISQNPYIDHYEDRLAEIRESKGLKETDSLYQREYLGKIVYDIDALVYRLTDQNYYTDEQLTAWLKDQPVVDLSFTAGLDYGFSDSDAICIILHSQSRRERFMVYEYKMAHSGIEDCARAVKAAIDFLDADPRFAQINKSNLWFMADSGGLGKKISFEIATHYNLPVADAYKVDKNNAIELLQQEVRQGTLKVKKGGIFDEEAKMLVFERDDNDNIVRVIDDTVYHGDISDAALYSMRPVWLLSEQRLSNRQK